MALCVTLVVFPCVVLSVVRVLPPSWTWTCTDSGRVQVVDAHPRVLVYPRCAGSEVKKIFAALSELWKNIGPISFVDRKEQN